MREAHPIDGIMPMPFGMIEDPVSDAERMDVAGTCIEDLALPMPALVDRVDDKVSRAYGGWPDRLYVVDKDGKIAYAGDKGPRGFDPDGWEKAIITEKARQAAGGTGGKQPDPPPGEPGSKPSPSGNGG